MVLVDFKRLLLQRHCVLLHQFLLITQPFLMGRQFVLKLSHQLVILCDLGAQVIVAGFIAVDFIVEVFYGLLALYKHFIPFMIIIVIVDGILRPLIF